MVAYLDKMSISKLSLRKHQRCRTKMWPASLQIESDSKHLDATFQSCCTK